MLSIVLRTSCNISFIVKCSFFPSDFGELIAGLSFFLDDEDSIFLIAVETRDGDGVDRDLAALEGYAGGNSSERR